MLCKVCGAQIPDDAQECEFCGTKVNEDTSMAEETKVINTDEIENAYQEHQAELEEKLNDEQNDNSENNEEQEHSEDDEIYDDNERRRREQVKKMMEDKKQQLSEIERRRNEKRRKQRRNRIVLIGAICALAVAAAGIGVYYLASNINSGNVIEETPIPSMAVVSTPSVISTPLTSEMPAQTPDLSMETSPRDENSTSSNNQSWSATGNTGSGGTSSGNRSTASSGTASKGNTSSGSSSKVVSSGTSSSSSSSASSSSGGGTSSSSNTSSAQNSGVSSSNIASQLSIGGEVIYDSNAGKYLMTFVTNNVRYYATVSAGSTTEQINGKTYTITAVPTSETYNGNTVYDITSITNYAGDYILENSGTKLLTNDDIKEMSKHDLALARNEIYARHGRKFQTEEYSKYFSGKSWYTINPNYNYSDDDSNLNTIEIKNVQFILNAERN